MGRRLLRVRKHKVVLRPHKLAAEPVVVRKVAAAAAAAVAVALRNTLRQQAQRT